MAEKDQELLTRLRESDRDAFRDLLQNIINRYLIL